MQKKFRLYNDFENQCLLHALVVAYILFKLKKDEFLMMKTKIIANYLPQFHEIEENNKWWGKGYTDWVAVKKAKPLYNGHNQPNIPLDKNYYDLSDIDSIKWQVQLARKYNVYGFAIYHYWFNSQLHLLDKPYILLNQNKNIDINYCFIWDNSTWKRTWANVKFGNDWTSDVAMNNKNTGDTGILANLIYGGEGDWRIHFDYLLPFFKDDRYIKIEGKPIFGIFNQDNDPETLKEILNYWNDLAKSNGLNGVIFLGRRNSRNIRISQFEYDYEPIQHGWTSSSYIGSICQKIRNISHRKFNVIDKYSYDKIWQRILESAKKCSDPSRFYGAFVNYDDTPRRGKKGKLVVGGSADKFGEYVNELLNISAYQNKEYVFLTAWNEWGEGAYMEPDERNSYSYLESLL